MCAGGGTVAVSAEEEGGLGVVRIAISSGMGVG